MYISHRRLGFSTGSRWQRKQKSHSSPAGPFDSNRSQGGKMESSEHLRREETGEHSSLVFSIVAEKLLSALEADTRGTEAPLQLKHVPPPRDAAHMGLCSIPCI